MGVIIINTINNTSSVKNFFVKLYNNNLFAYLLPLVVLGGYYSLLIAKQGLSAVQGYYLIHYLYTYTHGFVARGLVGEVLSKMFDIITPEITKWTVFFFSCALIFVSSLCIGKALNLSKKNNTFAPVLLLIILICLAPITFKYYLMDVKLDKILWFLTLCAVLLSGKKYGIWFTPALCFIATLVNPVYLFCSMILIAIILLQKFYDNHYSVKNGLICFLSYFGMIGIGIYGVWSEKQLGFATPSEMVNYYFSRYSQVLDADIVQQYNTEWLFDYFEPMKKCFEMAYKIYFVEWGNGAETIFNFIFFSLPVFIVLGLFWKTCMKCAENKFQKFIFFLCMISPIVTVPPVLISWEGSKYFGGIIIVQLCLIIWYLVNNNQAFIKAYKMAVNFMKRNLIVALLCFGYVGFMFYNFFN